MKSLEQLVVGVLGNPNSGKSKTWYKLFDRDVNTTQKNPHWLELRPGQWVEVIVINSSPEESGLDLADKLNRQKNPMKQCECPIVLCSMQYNNNVSLDYFIDRKYTLYIQWINPGYKQDRETEDRSITEKILSAESVFSIREGSDENLDHRVQEIREFIYGWAKYRHPRFS